MSELFKLVSKKFVDKEWRWTYSCLFNFSFKKQIISEITITNHYQLEHKKTITNKLILDILKEKIQGRKRMKPRKRVGIRDIYVLERTLYQDKKYRLIFWFKDCATNHLWIRNCHPQD